MNWKKISNFSKYEVSEYGEIRNIKTGNFLKPSINSGNGYLTISLYRNDHIRTTITIHKIVATTWIINPNNFNIINHIDGNKLNNYYKNLEWVTSSYNQKHAFKIGLKSNKKGFEHPQSKSVLQKDLEGNYIKSYGSMNQILISYPKAQSGLISQCCNKKRPSHLGFIWEFS